MSKSKTYSFRVGPRRRLLLVVSAVLSLFGIFALGFVLGARANARATPVESIVGPAPGGRPPAQTDDAPAEPVQDPPADSSRGSTNTPELYRGPLRDWYYAEAAPRYAVEAGPFNDGDLARSVALGYERSGFEAEVHERSAAEDPSTFAVRLLIGVDSVFASRVARLLPLDPGVHASAVRVVGGSRVPSKSSTAGGRELNRRKDPG